MSKRIFVVDNDQTIRIILQELLEDEAYEVDTASDGLIAWEKLTQWPGSYEVILLDMQMPRMDGLQLIRQLRNRQGRVLDSIIVMSADYEAIQDAGNMGVCHAVTKPFDLEAILEMVSSCYLSLSSEKRQMEVVPQIV